MGKLRGKGEVYSKKQVKGVTLFQASLPLTSDGNADRLSVFDAILPRFQEFATNKK